TSSLTLAWAVFTKTGNVRSGFPWSDYEVSHAALLGKRRGNLEDWRNKKRINHIHHCPNSTGNCPIPHALTVMPLEKLCSSMCTVLVLVVVVVELLVCQNIQPSDPVDSVLEL